MLHPLPLPLSSCLGCIPPLIGLPSLRFYAVGSSLFLLSVCFCLCSLFYRDDVLCWLLLARPFLYAFHAHLRFPVDLVWFRLSCDHGWIRSGSVNVRKQQQQQQHTYIRTYIHTYIYTYIHTYINTYTHTYIHAYINTYIHAYMHTYIHTYIHTNIHIYIRRV